MKRDFSACTQLTDGCFFVSARDKLITIIIIMKYIRNAAGALILTSATACGTLPEFAKILTPSQDEQVAFVYQDTEAMMPLVEKLWENADPLYDAQGEPVEDNEVMIDDFYGVLADFHYYKEYQKIYAFSPADAEAAGFFLADEASGYFVDKHYEENLYGNDNVLLSEDLNWWDATLLMHEIGHRTDGHDDNYYAYIVDELKCSIDYNRSYGEWLASSGDWAELQGTTFDLVSNAFDDLQTARNRSRDFREMRGDSQAIVDSWESVSSLILNGLESDFEHWHAGIIENIWINNVDADGFFDVFGLTKVDVEKAFDNEAVFKYMRLEIQKEYDHCREVYNEAQAELDRERKTEFTPRLKW